MGWCLRMYLTAERTDVWLPKELAEHHQAHPPTSIGPPSLMARRAYGALPAEVYLAEALGNETLVRLQVGGQELVARADASYEPAIGAHVWVQPDLRHAHLFDARTEQRIV